MALASFEGRYPKDLFNKSVYTDDSQAPVGYVAKETDNIIVVFSESDKKVRYDIPKSEIALAGGSVIIQNGQSVLSRYKVKRSTPLPEGKDSTAAPGGDEIAVQEGKQSEAHPETDKRMEKFKMTSVTLPSEIVESSNRVITTDSKVIEAKKPSTKNTDSASPVKLPSAVLTVAPKDDNKATISTQVISSTPVKDPPQSTETTNTADEERQLSSLTPEYADVKDPEADVTLSSPTATEVTDLGTTNTDIPSIDNKPASAEPLLEQQSLSEAKDEELIQQATSELEYVAEANVVSRIEPSSSMLEESRPYSSSVGAIAKSDEEGQLTSRDEANVVVMQNDTPVTYSDYRLNSTTAWQAWSDMYNEFTTSAVRSSISWFNLLWKLWLPASPSIQESDDNSRR